MYQQISIAIHASPVPNETDEAIEQRVKKHYEGLMGLASRIIGQLKDGNKEPLEAFVKSVHNASTGCAAERLQPALQAATLALDRGDIIDLEVLMKAEQTVPETIRTHIQGIFDIETIINGAADVKKAHQMSHQRLFELLSGWKVRLPGGETVSANKGRDNRQYCKNSPIY